eukprot:342027-Pleurochrysis_carterae.AAC.1
MGAVRRPNRVTCIWTGAVYEATSRDASCRDTFNHPSVCRDSGGEKLAIAVGREGGRLVATRRSASSLFFFWHECLVARARSGLRPCCWRSRITLRCAPNPPAHHMLASCEGVRVPVLTAA